MAYVRKFCTDLLSERQTKAGNYEHTILSLSLSLSLSLTPHLIIHSPTHMTYDLMTYDRLNMSDLVLTEHV